MKIQGSTFLVTGGSSGLGLATVNRLVENGGNVVVADMQQGDLPPQAVYIRTSVTNPDEVQAAVDLTFSKFGGLHGVIPYPTCKTYWLSMAGNCMIFSTFS